MSEWYENTELREPEDFEKLPALKLGSGVHDIKFENNGREVDVPVYGREDKKEKKIIFDVTYAGKKWCWFVRKAETTTSLFGQLTKVSQKQNGLQGHTVKIIAAGEKKARSYQVMDVDGVSVTGQ